MKKKGLLFLFAALGVTFISTAIFGEYVFLKDGSIIEGAIISESSASVTIRDTQKKVLRIQRDNILRLLYTDIYMGKVYVQKNTGEVIACYMVDEDRESYTFRMDLYKPKEFKVLRDDVLFIARGNPTRLKVEGNPKIFEVDLTWFPPYTKVKGYNIYLKTKDDAEFKLHSSCKKNIETVKNLKSNTEYEAMVKAIDADDEESLPTNKIKFKTANRPPDAPTETVLKNTAVKGEPVEFTLTWNEAVDHDGEVVSYKVYRKIEKEVKLIAEFDKKKKGYKPELKFDKNDYVDFLYITVIDDLGAESERKTVYGAVRKEFDLGVNAVGAYAIGDMANLTDYGYGAEIRGNFSNFFIKNLEFGFNIQCINFNTADDYNSNNVRLNQLLFMPVTVYGGYTFRPFSWLRIAPLLHAGASVVMLDYDIYEDSETEDDSENVSGMIYRGAAGIEVSARIDAGNKVYVEMKLGAMGIIESAVFPYAVCSLGAGYRF